MVTIHLDTIHLGTVLVIVSSPVALVEKDNLPYTKNALISTESAQILVSTRHFSRNAIIISHPLLSTGYVLFQRKR